MSSIAVPLTLTLAMQKPRLSVGEGITIGISHQVHSNLEMETVELNANRTEIHITDGAGTQRTLTGRDYADLHRHPTLQEIGRTFQARSGDAWNTMLELFLYTKPLPPGDYRVDISYRYGGTQEESVRSNAVEFEVSATDAVGKNYRWFGGGRPRQELASLWARQDGDKFRWFYEVADAHDPDSVRTSTDLDLCLPSTTIPELSHLNDIPAYHFDRYAVWAEPERVGWVRVQPYGRLSEPMFAPHELSALSAVRIVSPPLQLREEGFRVLLVGNNAEGSPAVSLVEVGEGKSSRHRIISLASRLPDHIVAGWGADEELISGALYRIDSPRSPGTSHVVRTDLRTGNHREIYDTVGVMAALVIDQWMGQGHVFAAIRHEQLIEVKAWDLENEDSQPETVASHDLRGRGPLEGPLKAEPLGEGRDLALLFRGDAHWAVMTRKKEWKVPFLEDLTAQPDIVTTPEDGIYLVFKGRMLGFRIVHLH